MSEEKETKHSEDCGYSVLCVKRKRTEPPNNSLYVTSKRQKVFNEFTLIQSSSTKPYNFEDIVRTHTQKKDFRERHKESNCGKLDDIKSRQRKNLSISQKEQRYNAISISRNINGSNVISVTRDGDVKEPEKNDDDIVCNAQKMLSTKLSISAGAAKPFISDGAAEWVYDIYLPSNATDYTSFIENEDVLVSSTLVHEDSDTEHVSYAGYNEYDDDSNDENYYANDYPDELSSTSSDSKNGEGDDLLFYNERASNDYFFRENHMQSVYDKFLVSDTDSD